MPTRSHHSRRPKVARPDVLATIAETIDAAFDHLTVDDPAHLLRIISASERLEDIELGLLPLPAGLHPAEAMAGFTAPADWMAVGLVTTASSHELEAEHPCGTKAAHQAVRLTFLLARSGEACTLLSPIGSEDSRRRRLDEPPIGLLPDACRRMLGLATAPPADGPEVWLTARWLDRMLAQIIERTDAVPAWEGAVALHPLVPPGAAPSAEGLAAMVEAAGSAFEWERLRLLAIKADAPDPAINPTVAAWMDAGSFARHMLAAELPIDLLLTELGALLPAEVMRQVREALPRSALGRFR